MRVGDVVVVRYSGCGFEVATHIHSESMDEGEGKAKALNFYCPQKEKSLHKHLMHNIVCI